LNTTYFQNVVMGNLFKTKTSPALPTAYYIGLSSTTPTVAGACTEPSTIGTGYARVQLSNLSEPTNGVITNSAAVSFPESKTDWGTMTHYAVFDAATGGNLLFYNNLSISRKVEPNTVITIKANQLKVSLEPPAAS